MARAIGANLVCTAYDLAAAAVVYVGRHVVLAASAENPVAISPAFVAGRNITLPLHTSSIGVGERADVAAGATVVDVVLFVESVVNDAVAVVFRVIAGFRLRQNFADTCSPGTIRLTCLHTCCADTDTHCVDRAAIARAVLSKRALPGDALARHTRFRRRARVAATAAIGRIRRRIYAPVAAWNGPHRTDAGTIQAGFGACASISARAAVASVTGRIDTDVAAQCCTGWTDAGTVLAGCSVWAAIAARAAITRITQDVDAVVIAEPGRGWWAAVWLI